MNLRPIGLAAIAAAAFPACVQAPRPTPMAPHRQVARAAPRDPAVLALLDFADLRPIAERGRARIEELPTGGEWFARDRFWSFHDDAATLEQDPGVAPECHGRITGDGAFAWYPFPNHGVGAPRVAPLTIALPDYLALLIEQRGLFNRVVRCRDESAAAELGASLVLHGRIDHFASLLTARPDPFAVRPDDRAEFRLVAGADFSVEIRESGATEALFERRCRARDDQGRLQQQLEHYRGSQASPWWRLDAGDFPAMAQHDLGDRARRALTEAAGFLLAELELATAARALAGSATDSQATLSDRTEGVPPTRGFSRLP
jgi:hypothetical protein